MIRFLLIPLIFLSLPAAARAQAEITDRLRDEGLQPTEAYLAGLEAPDATERFALGAVRFLRGIEKTLQTRWLLGMNAARTELPVLRLPVPANPDPQPFTGDAIDALVVDLIADLDAARAPLLTIGDEDAVSLPVSLDALWFDINLNGTRDDGEGLMNVAGRALTGRGMGGDTGAQVVFDTADAAWLAAYTHFLSAFGEIVLAFDPAGQIARVVEASREMDALAADTPYQNAMDMQFGQQVDRIAMIYFALQQQPDAAHTMAAREHLLQMIAQNRVFWARVAAETDDRGEWVPNDMQSQALGLRVPEGTGARWQAVLDDAEALLNGEKLIPFWRLRSGAGLNLKRMFEDPVPVDLAEWIHGIGLMRYAEEGPRVAPDSWLDFERLMRGQSLLYVVFLN
ncbi:hypothetical protein P1J78_16225 [Psychromarinibacter sp. C21-152]|uniref:Uncharacterized protein n=1 Tax=Psychromarinibacter sediminicola TaxID=3033385 RepID=A0AAE3T9Y1_9RHOB|nr:hypothetical protein [Psychromarinibacter sediminicola]MDF0602288.1 hypothetical protein [Psychromarinibacter sediminicola]